MHEAILVATFGALLVFFLIALSADRWFAKIAFVRRLRESKAAIDGEIVRLPTPPLTINSIRDHEHIGEKIVVVHCLLGMSDDVQRKISRGILLAVIGALVLQFAFVLFTISRLNPATIMQARDAFEQVASQTWAISLAPLSATVMSFLYVGIAAFLLEEQVHKCRSVFPSNAGAATSATPLVEKSDAALPPAQ